VLQHATAVAGNEYRKQGQSHRRYRNGVLLRSENKDEKETDRQKASQSAQQIATTKHNEQAGRKGGGIME